MSDKPWIGVDFDRTIAVYGGSHHIGQTAEQVEPVPAMVERVIAWLSEGKRVKIVTARVARREPDRDVHVGMIRAWCHRHLGQPLEITSEKDYLMVELWDDNAVRVERNTGRRLSPSWVETTDGDTDKIKALRDALDALPEAMQVHDDVGEALQNVINAAREITG
jgi:hypothetical protein